MSFSKHVSCAEDGRCGIILDGVCYTHMDCLIALAKALIKQGVITKAEVVAELP